jgi:peroxiredoxin
VREFLIVLGAALSFTSPATAALKLGDTAPDFTTQGALAGKAFTVSLSKALKKGPVVLYFFPKTFTSGCTIEANMFAEASAQFRAAGATVIGMSADTIESLKKFSTEECRDEFAVARADASIVKGYDVRMAPVLKMTSRTSYVINQSGRIVLSYSDMNPKEHVKRTLEMVQSMRAD